uniref:ORF_10L n=1 Tax=Human herpesvirus 1 (strain R15) TaxID=36345 RepID=Q6VB71_HHV1R|nr:ORF_10L [Human alphaherpesvirus 1 strain R-15]
MRCHAGRGAGPPALTPRPWQMARMGGAGGSTNGPRPRAPGVPASGRGRA